MEERRQSPRISLRVHAKGSLRAGENILPFSAYVLNLSAGGAQLRLGGESARMIREAARGGADLKSAAIDMRIISYVEDTARVSARIAYLKGDGADVIMGLKFENLDSQTPEILARVMQSRPDVDENAGARLTDDTPHFGSTDDFIDNLTHFTILSEKEGEFYIGGERFVFIGMHKNDKNEIHIDCIESVDNPGYVFCPDCNARINPSSLI